LEAGRQRIGGKQELHRLSACIHKYLKHPAAGDLRKNTGILDLYEKEKALLKCEGEGQGGRCV
jgi:hypothetical protein